MKEKMFKLQPIIKVARKIGVKKSSLLLFGNSIAKVENEKGKKQGKLILVTAMTSNKYGIGKTTVSIGLADALKFLNKNTMLALREPSMGPVFGIKGGATGGGMSMVEPSDEINLHFTGDFHAVSQATNLLASIVDNHIFQGNELNIDINKIFIKRCLDVNDRSLREVKYSINNQEIKSGFVITAASEVMAILCLAKNLEDLKIRLGNILVGMSKNNKPIYAKDLQAEESVALLLVNALKPNLVQTLNGTPALVHLGPFANIAHGCNSVVATNFALTHSDFCVTEAGFGSDLGAEKFLDIKTRILNKTPDVCVLVIVVNVIKEHGNGDLVLGFENVKAHIENLKNQFGLNVVISINKHKTDSDREIKKLIKLCEKLNIPTAVTESYDKGINGTLELAKLVLGEAEKASNFHYVYDMQDSIKDKIKKIATKIYHARSVKFSTVVEEKIKLANDLGFNDFFVNIAKTQFSFTDNKTKVGAPKNFIFNITDLEIRAGAKMLVAVAGDMLLMPGLGKKSNYLNMKIENNKTVGVC